MRPPQKCGGLVVFGGGCDGVAWNQPGVVREPVETPLT